jgi:SAM-dependent methyltransferase
MQPIEYDLMYELEERLWWYRGMQAITRALLERFYARGGGLRILDAGCGTGGAMKFLADYGTVMGVDLAPYALRLAAKRGPRALACASLAALPLAAEQFDLVTSFDVLVSLDKAAERSALGELARALRPGGRLVVRVAAYDWLRGAHDRAWRVQHRYTAPDLRGRLERAGLRVEVMSYANMWLFPLAAAKRLSEHLLPPKETSELTISFGATEGLFRAILASEAGLVARGLLPFGLSLVAVARKAGK